jgi:hypothetical protein
MAVHRTPFVAEARSIDSYVSSKAIHPDFIKIDAESAEMQVIEGAMETLKSDRPILIIEVGDYGISGIPLSEEIVSFLVDLGYSAFDLSENEITEHTKRGRLQYGNVLFLPQA